MNDAPGNPIIYTIVSPVASFIIAAMSSMALCGAAQDTSHHAIGMYVPLDASKALESLDGFHRLG